MEKPAYHVLGDKETGLQMNITDVDQKKIQVPEKNVDLLRTIRAHQNELMVKYQDIEKIPLWPCPFQNKDSQRWFKECLWRVTEEVSEAMEALLEVDEKGAIQLMHRHITHFFEEISDALHFLVEVSICADVPIQLKGHQHDALMKSWEMGWAEYGERRNDPAASLGQAFFCQKDTMFFDAEGEMQPILSSKLSRKALELEILIVLERCSMVQYRLGLCGNVLKNKAWKQTDMMSDHAVFCHRLHRVFNVLFLLLFECGFDPKSVYLLYVQKKLVNEWRQDTKY